MLPKSRYASFVLVTFVVLILGPWDHTPSELYHQKHLIQTNHNRLARPVDEVVSPAELTPRSTTAALPFPSAAGAASAAPTTGTSSRPNSERLRKEVLGLIRFPWQKLGYEKEFLRPRPRYRPMTNTDTRRIEINNRP